jgi:hypothetical protein
MIIQYVHTHSINHSIFEAMVKVVHENSTITRPTYGVLQCHANIEKSCNIVHNSVLIQIMVIKRPVPQENAQGSEK